MGPALFIGLRWFLLCLLLGVAWAGLWILTGDTQNMPKVLAATLWVAAFQAGWLVTPVRRIVIPFVGWISLLAGVALITLLAVLTMNDMALLSPDVVPFAYTPLPLMESNSVSILEALGQGLPDGGMIMPHSFYDGDGALVPWLMGLLLGGMAASGYLLGHVALFPQHPFLRVLLSGLVAWGLLLVLRVLPGTDLFGSDVLGFDLFVVVGLLLVMSLWASFQPDQKRYGMLN